MEEVRLNWPPLTQNVGRLQRALCRPVPMEEVRLLWLPPITQNVLGVDCSARCAAWCL